MSAPGAARVTIGVGVFSLGLSIRTKSFMAGHCTRQFVACEAKPTSSHAPSLKTSGAEGGGGNAHIEKEERGRQQVGGTRLAARQPIAPLPLRLRLTFALHVERDCFADELFQRGLVDLLAFVDIDRAPHVAVETRVEEAGGVLQRSPL